MCSSGNCMDQRVSQIVHAHYELDLKLKVLDRSSRRVPQPIAHFFFCPFLHPDSIIALPNMTRFSCEVSPGGVRALFN
jgi:hypothetical protein